MVAADDTPSDQDGPRLGRRVELISVVLTAPTAVGGLWYTAYSINQVNDELKINKE
jgi:hypothetical protein